MGFTATPNGVIYLFGGYSDYSGELERWIEEFTSAIRVIVSNNLAKPILSDISNSDGHIFNILICCSMLLSFIVNTVTTHSVCYLFR